MPEFIRQNQPTAQSHLIAGLAHDEPEALEAQRLRYKVFAEEMGASLPGTGEGIDRDIFDKYCDHLLVRESTDNKIVGTCRILPPGQAQKIGGYHLHTGFDLTRLLHLDGRMVEIGRACIHRDYREGETLDLLWDGIRQYMMQHGHEYLIGCASLSMADGGHTAASIYRKLHRIYGAPVEYSIFPRCPLPIQALNQFLDAPVPPLLKGYLHHGAYICGEPSWNADFNTADLPILLPMSRMSRYYAKHSLKTSKHFLRMPSAPVWT